MASSHRLGSVRKKRTGAGVIALVTSTALILTGCNSSGDDSKDKDKESTTTTTSAAESSGAESSSAESTAAAPSSITIKDDHGSQEIKLPVERLAVTDNRAFAVLDQWGVDLVAAPKGLVSPNIKRYRENDDILDLGMHFEPNLENLVAAKPDLIINGQRFAKQYPEIKKLNPDTPMIEFNPTKEGADFAQVMRDEVSALGQVMGKESEAKALIKDFDDAIENAKKAYDGEKTVMALIVSGGKIIYVVPGKGRTFGPLYDMIGMKPALEVEGATAGAHGDDISVEAIAEANPDILLVMDRDAPLKSAKKPEYVPAKKAIEESDALKNVNAVKNGAIYYSPMDTYLNESMPLYTEMMNGMTEAFKAAK